MPGAVQLKKGPVRGPRALTNHLDSEDAMTRWESMTWRKRTERSSVPLIRIISDGGISDRAASLVYGLANQVRCAKSMPC